MLKIIKKFFDKNELDEFIILARVYIDYDPPKNSPHSNSFSLKKNKVTYNVPFTMHLGELCYFYSVPQEQWDTPNVEEVRIETKTGKGMIICYNYLKLQAKFFKYCTP